jgi:hypothetical protein
VPLFSTRQSKTNCSNPHSSSTKNEATEQKNEIPKFCARLEKGKTGILLLHQKKME